MREYFWAICVRACESAAVRVLERWGECVCARVLLSVSVCVCALHSCRSSLTDCSEGGWSQTHTHTLGTCCAVNAGVAVAAAAEIRRVALTRAVCYFSYTDSVSDVLLSRTVLSRCVCPHVRCDCLLLCYRYTDTHTDTETHTPTHTHTVTSCLSKYCLSK